MFLDHKIHETPYKVIDNSECTCVEKTFQMN